jgi:hypothetical protein
MVTNTRGISEEHSTSIFNVYSESLVPSHIPAQCRNPEDHKINLHRHESSDPMQIPSCLYIETSLVRLLDG